MTLPQQAIAWWPFVPARLTPEAFIEAAAAAGYAAIDLAPPQFWEQIRAGGLQLSAIGGHGSLTQGLNRPANHDSICAEVTANLELAVKWGIPNLIVFSGNRAGLDDAAGASATAEGLARLAPLAEAAGVTLILELLNSKVDHPDYQCDHTPWAMEVVRQVDSPRVKVLYDIYHMQIMEGDLIRTIQEFHPHFAHYHTAGNPGRHEIDASQEIHYPAVLRAIAATGYRGYICHEFVPAGDALAALQGAFQLTWDSLAAIGNG
jgi:hydroxypyruvate isomerase